MGELRPQGTPPWANVVPPERRMDGQVAIVTGGGNGIGRATAVRFASVGARVVVLDRDRSAATAVADQILDAGGEAVAASADVSLSADIIRAVSETHNRWARVDVLVNNAGFAATTPFMDEDSNWKTTFDVNVYGPLVATQAVARIMRTQEPLASTECRGKIINVSSGAATSGRPLLAAYGASKAALNHLSMTSAVVLGPELISTTVITPGNVADGMWGEIGPQMARTEGRPVEQVVAERLAAVPTSRFQRPEETAELMLYVASFRGMGLNHQLVTTEPQVMPL